KAKNAAGVWSEASPETRVVLGMASKAEVISELKAYPNPADIRVTQPKIYYDLNQDSDVEITIYDLFGQVVRMINVKSGSEGGRLGANTVVWDGKRDDGAPTSFGVYLIRVKAIVTGSTRVYKLGVIH
ncbi:MAG: FlgD immunoglobulin-like domain containing protein, partial [Elusimicrobiota bacterium]